MVWEWTTRGCHDEFKVGWCISNHRHGKRRYRGAWKPTPASVGKPVLTDAALGFDFIQRKVRGGWGISRSISTTALCRVLYTIVYIVFNLSTTNWVISCIVMLPSLYL